MARLPVPYSDNEVWGGVLNNYLLVAHNEDGTLKDAGVIAAKYVKPTGGIPLADLSASLQTSIAGPTIFVQSTTPSNPSDGDLWVNTA